MNSTIKVSVITPSYNQGDYIEEAINSVLNQSYENIEYIVVDGGSTDQTINILDAYKEHFTLISGEDDGQSDAINIGMKRSTGDLVGWLNADDIYEQDGIETIVSLYREKPEHSIYYGGIRLINRDGQFLGFPKWGPITYERLLKGLPEVWQPGSFYPASLLEQVGYLDPGLEMIMDLDLYLKLVQLAPAAFIPEFVARQRVHGETKSSRMQLVSFREGIRVRMKQKIPMTSFLYYLIRRSLVLAKFYLINRKQVIEWDAESGFGELD